MISKKITGMFLATAFISTSALTGLATTANADELDMSQKRCGKALVTAKVEQDGNKNEVDVEVYSQGRNEQWRIIIKDSDGEVLHRVNRKTNREGEFDFWRPVSPAVQELTIRVTGPRGQKCSLELDARR